MTADACFYIAPELEPVTQLRLSPIHPSLESKEPGTPSSVQAV